jgi:hypothetical protein
MKRYLSVLAPSALLILLATAAAQDAKDKPAPPAKDKSEKADKAPPPAAKSDKDAAPKPAAVETLKDSPYYPLQVGNTWHYRLGDNRYVMRVAKHEKVGDYMCARVEMLIDDKPTAHEHIAVTADGIVRVAYDDRRAEPPILFLKVPPKKDETWKVDSFVGKTDKVPGEHVTGTFTEGEVAKLNEPSGSYENVITSTSQDLNANGQRLSFVYYFAKGVGMVKQEIDVAGQKVIVDLEKFESSKP